jgi:hypothetical protein
MLSKPGAPRTTLGSSEQEPPFLKCRKYLLSIILYNKDNRGKEKTHAAAL